jgi:hypothetical protein
VSVLPAVVLLGGPGAAGAEEAGVGPGGLDDVDADDAGPGGDETGQVGDAAADRGQRHGQHQRDDAEAEALAPGVGGPRRTGVAGHRHPLLRELPADTALDGTVDALVHLLQERVDQRGLVVLAQFPPGVQGGVEFLLQVGVTRVHSAHADQARDPGRRPHWG